MTVKRKGRKQTELKCSVQVRAATRARIRVEVTRNGRVYARAATTATGRTQRLSLRATRAATRRTYRITVRVTSRGGRTAVGSTATYRG